MKMQMKENINIEAIFNENQLLTKKAM